MVVMAISSIVMTRLTWMRQRRHLMVMMGMGSTIVIMRSAWVSIIVMMMGMMMGVWAMWRSS